MIFRTLADGIIKHHKLIILIWIVVIIISVPFMLKANSVLIYDNSQMSGGDSESAKGMEIMGTYFESSDIDMNQVALAVMTYDNSEGYNEALRFGDLFTKNMDTYLNADGTKKVEGIFPYGVYGEDTDGMMLYGITYTDKMIADGHVSNDTSNLREFIASIEEEDTSSITYLTGSPAITYDTQVGSMEDISKIDKFTILLILILVGLFFRSFVTSAMPPMIIGAALGVAMCALFFVGSVLDVFFITNMIMLVAMLGAGCDYCIFIVARYREERRKGLEHIDASREAITWAGESIVTSGIAVIIGFGVMSLYSFSMFSTMGVMLSIGISIALVAALTLMSSVLVLLGERIFWPSKISSFQEGSKAMKGWFGKCSRFGHRYFVRSAAFSIKHSKVILVAAILFTVPMAYIYSTSDYSYDMIGSTLTGESADGLESIEEYADGGMMMPDYDILELNKAIATISVLGEMEGKKIGLLTWNNDVDYYDRLSTLSSDIAKDENIGEVMGLFKWQDLTNAIPNPGLSDEDYLKYIFKELIEDEDLPSMLKPYLSAAAGEIIGNPLIPQVYNDPMLIGLMDFIMNYTAGGLGGAESQTISDGQTTTTSTIDATYVKYTIITKEQAMSNRSMDTLDYIDDVVHTFKNNNSDMVSEVWLTGIAAVMYDVSKQVGDEFIKVEFIAVLLIFILLFFVMKSYVTPLRSILTILMSFVWTVAITHLIFDNLTDTGVIWMIPIVLLVVCLGLGMDYDILLTTRIKENRLHKNMSNDEAITEAVIGSGPVITICGLIMGGAFGTLMFSGMDMLFQFGFVLSFAIIVDALIVRTYIVPAAMSLLGDLNWKGPKWLHKRNNN